MSDWKSQPLTTFLADVGEAVVSLNTVVVGLDAVEKGHEKPDSLDISWAPKDKRAAARKARKFVVEAVLVRVFDASFEHMSLLAKLSRFNAVTGKWDGKTSRATKIWEIYSAAVGENYLVAAAVLVCHWRNRIVHPSSGAKLTAAQKNLLRGTEAEIAEKYKKLSVDCLLCHFEESRPTLKDVSVLIAMTINLARAADAAIASTLSKEDFDSWLAHFGLDNAIEKVRRETKPNNLCSSIRRVFQARAPMMLQGYEQFYATTTEPAPE